MKLKVIELDRMEFVKQNNILEYSYFSNNHDAIMTVYTICALFKNFFINNLFINNDTIYFELNNPKKPIPIINSSSIYDKYNVNYNINNNTIGITMKKVSG